MSRKLFILSIIFGLMFASTTPVQAISYGTFDGDDHPNVGSMVVRVGEVYYQWCSGTLISPTVFLTASHCTEPLDWFIPANPGAVVLVTFDQTISANSTYYTGVWYTNPDYYTARGYDDPGDVAVIVLEEQPTGITPAQLPPAGL